VIGKVSNKSQSTKHIVIALGGNAILKAHQKGILEEQLENIRVTSEQILFCTISYRPMESIGMS